MHTVRNRVASCPRPPKGADRAGGGNGKVPKAPNGASGRKGRKRSEPAFLLQQSNPPSFPAHLILPVPRGAVIASVPWPEASAAAAEVAPVKKPRKAAGQNSTSPRRRKPAARKAAPRKATRKAPGKGLRKDGTPKARKPRTRVASALPAGETPVVMTTDLLDRALALRPDALALSPAPVSTPISAPISVAASQNAVDPSPLPRTRALALVQGSGLLDVIGSWLRGAGQRLAAWRSQRSLAAKDRSRLARANARQRMLQSQFDALEALQAHVTPPNA